MLTRIIAAYVVQALRGKSLDLEGLSMGLQEDVRSQL
jgi:hypothetical protein